MRAQELKGRILVILAVITLPAVSASILCFCNSPSCPQAVCKSSQRCFTRLQKKASADGNVSTSILYGCTEALNSNGACSESSFMMCCGTPLCNMPNMLRKATKIHQRRSPLHTTHAPKVNKNVTCKCASSSPAMRVASVVAPSVLILTVILLSLAVCRKMTLYHKNKNSQLMSSSVKYRWPQLKSSVDSGIPQSISAGSTSTSYCSYRDLVTNPHSV